MSAGEHSSGTTRRPSIAACVITSRGSEDLARLLESLVDQHVPNAAYQIIVVDNHSSESARETVERFRNNEVAVTYEVEPTPGIPFARNRSIRMARDAQVDYAAFIDDDEVASPNWIEHLVRRLETSGAAAVSGPVRPVFPTGAPAWAEASGLYSRPEFRDGAELDYASTANSAIRLQAFQAIDAIFSADFQFTGGSDTFLYQQLRERGGRIVWDSRALVYEHVPLERTSMRWLIARNFRHGITLGRCDRMVHGIGLRTVRRLVRGLGLIVFGILETVAGAALRIHRWRRGLTRISRGVGIMAGTFGISYREYRRS